MSLKDISPDAVILWQGKGISLNATILFTWLVLLLLTLVSWLATRNLSAGIKISRWQNLLEALVSGIRNQIHEVCQRKTDRYLPFIGALFLYIAACNFLTIFPGYLAPTGSLSTTVALAICVFIAVPVFGVADQGLRGYLKRYIQPNVFMLPFHVIGEFSRTLALAVRLFGNIMSGTKIVAILIAIAPLFFPIFMHALGLLTGLIQAYIFAILAMVYIASATRTQQEKEEAARSQSETTANQTSLDNRKEIGKNG